MEKYREFLFSLAPEQVLSWYGTPWFHPDPNVDATLTFNTVQQWLPGELNGSQAVIDLRKGHQSADRKKLTSRPSTP